VARLTTRLPAGGFALARLRPLLRPHAPRLAIAAVLLLVAAVAGLVFPAVLRVLLDSAFEARDRGALDRLALLLVGVFAVQALANFGQVFLLSSTTERIVAALRVQAFAHAIRLDPAFFAARRTGELTSRLAADLGVLQSFLATWVSELSRQLVFLVGGVVMLFVTNPGLTLTTLAVVPLVVGAALLFGRALRRATTTVQDRVAEAMGMADEAFGAIRTVQSFTREQAEADRFATRLAALVTVAVSRARTRALFFSVVGFVESVSVGQTLAAKRRQRIEPDQELVALGASNLSAAFTGGFPVTGGFARSVVNFDAGAVTPAAGVYTAVGITLASLFLTPALFYLPQATLAATIVVAVLSLVDFSILKSTWRFSKLDFIAVATTLLATLLVGVESGLVMGVVVSLALFLFRASRPHIATVGLVPGTEYFRNVLRHDVLVSPKLVCLRVDASMFFANARGVEDRINAEVASRPELEHVLLQCSAVNDIDASALESLEAIASRLKDSGIALHFSEIKGPVMDKLNTTHFLKHLPGQVFLTNYQAIQALTPEVIH
jgi:ABC-type multidrug transport system fused ATPase/permease subunit/anti-anti-sigma regulatory factor